MTLLAVGALAAQGPGTAALQGLRPSQRPQGAEVPDGGWTFLGTAKWAGLAISGGAAVFGFSLNSQADDVFARLEALCEDDPARCERRNPDGSFVDSELEGLYQDSVAKDREARAALLVSQVTLAASVVFFILDLSSRPPENIPYDPPVAVKVEPHRGGRIAASIRVREAALVRLVR